MKLYNLKYNKFRGLSYAFVALLSTILVFSCDFTYELPEAGSIADETPPSAAFSSSQNEANFLQVDFTNNSISSTEYSWDFGDGATSSDKEPSHVYAEEGTYTVTLRAVDKLNASDEETKDVAVIKPIITFTPVILEAGFEDGSLPDDTGDGRDSWRNDIGGVIQITSSPVFTGEQAAKLPAEGDRAGLQLFSVLPDTDYVVKFYYTMKAEPGTLTVAILDGIVTTIDDVAGATIAKVDLTDNSDPNTYVQAVLPFNSGGNSEVAIYFGNTGSECRLDDFTIE